MSLDLVDAFYEKAREAFYLDAGAVREAIRSRSSFNLIHLTTLFKADIFIPTEKPISRSQLENRVPLRLGDAGEHEIYVLSPEDAVLQKLLWFDLGNRVSDRQWSDVLGILKTQREKLDFEFLQAMANQSGLGGLLENALEEASG